MVVPLLAEGFGRGITNIPHIWTVAKYAAIATVVYLLKLYFGGARCQVDRNMHGKVVMITGGTSGIGALVVKELASRGAHIILLTQHEPSDAFLVEYVDDLRTQCNNELIYVERVDLCSLHSIRRFATKWVDNAPPRRLDMIVLCANTMTPKWGTAVLSEDGVEEEWMVNYLSTFHLLSILSPAIRAQPPDRDVRILFGSCSSYIGAKLDLEDDSTEKSTTDGGKSYGRSKLALMCFVDAFQKHLDSYKRPDGLPNNARALIVDPGYTRTPGMRRWLTGGTLIGLFIYIVTWPIWWLVLKSPEQGAQSFLHCAFEAKYATEQGGKIVKECREIQPLRAEVRSEDVAKQLWEYSEKQIEKLEKQGAVRRALRKSEKDTAAKDEKSSPKQDIHTSDKDLLTKSVKTKPARPK